MDLLEQVQRRAARFVTKTYSRDEGCVSQDNYSTIYIGQPQEANSKAMHALKTLNNEEEITVPTYVQHQKLQRTGHPHPLQATCDAYKFSFWPLSIKDGNSLHVDIIQSIELN